MTKKYRVHQAIPRPRRLEKDQISLTKTNLVISEELAEEHLKDVRRVVFLYDPEKRVIGIRPAENSEKGFKISYRSVSSLSFCKHFGIQERGRFRARFDGEALLIALDEPSD